MRTRPRFLGSINTNGASCKHSQWNEGGVRSPTDHIGKTSEQPGDENLSATYDVFIWAFQLPKNSRWWNDKHRFLESLECITSKHNIRNDSSHRWRMCAGVINPALPGTRETLAFTWDPCFLGEAVVVAQKTNLGFGALGKECWNNCFVTEDLVI